LYVLRVLCLMDSAETTAVSDAETELIVADVDERRPIRRESRPHVDDLTKTNAYTALIEQLEQLPLDGEVLSAPVPGS